MIFQCDNCNEPFNGWWAYIKNNKSHCCSHKCSKEFKLKRLIKKLPTGCWQYMGNIYSNGYGNHRSVYERMKNVKIPKGLHLDHLCRNTQCVNPDHLEPVTIAENIRRGKAAKLNKEDIKEIFIIKNSGITQTAIAKIFKVNQCNISRIINGLRWSSKPKENICVQR